MSGETWYLDNSSYFIVGKHSGNKNCRNRRSMMARRATWRIPIRLKVILKSGGRVCPGVALNISENGMFINTDDPACPDSNQYDISIPVEDGTLQVPAKLVRLSKNNGGHEGIGVKLLNPSENYLTFVENLLFVL